MNAKKIGRVINGVIHRSVRFTRAVSGPRPGRMGSCTPDKCSTKDGVVGNACCRLNFTCPALKGQCSIYQIRPINCRSFPMSKADVKLVNDCGYFWEDANSKKTNK